MPRPTSRLFPFLSRSRRQIAREVDAELAFHLEMRVEELTRAGLAPDAARRAAREEFGDLEFTRAYCRGLDERTERAARTSGALTELGQDLRHAWRTIRRSPGYAAAALLTLVLAVGANTAVFSVTRAVLLRPLPYGSPGSLVSLVESSPSYPGGLDVISTPNFADYRAAQRGLTGLAASDGRSVTWRPASGDPELLDALSVTTNTFDLLEVRPLLGRGFSAADSAAGAPPVAVLSYDFWRNALGGAPGVVGTTLTLNDLPYTVVGVMPRDFTLGQDAALWTPLDLARDLAHPEITRKQFHLRAFARLKPGVSLALARADLQAISRRLAAQYPEADRGRVVDLVPLRTALVGDLATPVLLVQLATGLLLLLACANLANLTLARAVARRRELAVRAALGAGRWRQVRLLLAESLLLAVAGGGLGIALAVAGTPLLLGLEPGALPPLFPVRPDPVVLAIGVLLALATGVVSGLVPALGAARADLQASLKENGRAAAGGVSGERLRRILVAVQVGVAAVLLVGAGLLARSFARLTRAPLGFEPDHVLTAEVRVSGERYDDPALVNRFYDQVLGTLGHDPGVVAAGATMKLPTRGWITSNLVVEGEPNDPTRPNDIGYLLVRGDYFKAIGVPLIEGRFFDDEDTPNGVGAVLINQAAARAYFPRLDPVGRRIRLGPDPSAAWSVVVGVVGDVREQGFDVPAAPAVYPDHVQNTWWRSLILTVRTRGDPLRAEPLVRAAVHDADPTLALRAVRTLDEALGSNLAARRFALWLVLCFAGVALALAAVGTYGVLAFTVSSRTREFGVRLALGATRRSVLLLVLRQGVTWAGVGLVAGLAGAAVGGPLLRGLLYAVRPADGATFAAVAGLLVSVVLVACLVPAARATRADPVESMRAD